MVVATTGRLGLQAGWLRRHFDRLRKRSNLQHDTESNNPIHSELDPTREGFHLCVTRGDLMSARGERRKRIGAGAWDITCQRRPEPSSMTSIRAATMGERVVSLTAPRIWPAVL